VLKLPLNSLSSFVDDGVKGCEFAEVVLDVKNVAISAVGLAVVVN
jgi:hypothetical protein